MLRNAEGATEVLPADLRGTLSTKKSTVSTQEEPELPDGEAGEPPLVCWRGNGPPVGAAAPLSELPAWTPCHHRLQDSPLWSLRS